MLLLKFPMIISMLVVRLEFITLGSHPLLILYQIICLDSKIDNLFSLITPHTYDRSMPAVAGIDNLC